VFTPNLLIGGALFHPEAWPRIAHLDDILPFVADNKGIRLFQQGPIQILRYLINDPSVFQTPHDLECRGLVFDAATGALLSRPLHKFHNHAGPTTAEALMAAGPVRFFDKLDGSMLGGFLRNGQVALHTKGGFSSQARMALERIPGGHRALVQEAWDLGATPVFEWVGPDNRIVLPYAREDFVLLALRDRLTGVYLDDLADALAARHGVARPHVLGVAQDVEELHTWSARIAGMEGVEGAVAAGPDGRRAKLKTRSYLAVHKALSMLSHPRHAFRAVVEELDDDLVPLLPPDQAAFFTAYATALRQRVLVLAEGAEAQAEVLRLAHKGDKRAIAAAVNTTTEPLWRPLVFAAVGGKNPADALFDMLRKRTGTGLAVEEVSALYGLPTWAPPEGLFLQD
jgi:RNA ligase